MKRLFISLLALAPLLTASSAFAHPLQEDVDQAVVIIERFKDMPEHGIPRQVLKDAKGLAILTVIKAGFVISGRGGEGLVIARTGKGWSGPSAIGTGGAGFGLQIGAEVTEFLLVLNTPEAVQAFAHGGNVTLGAQLSAAAGPVGRDMEAAVTPTAAIYTYSRSQGLFGGISLEGTVVATRDDANTAYYGHQVSPKDILAGRTAPPKGASRLIRELENY